MAPALDIDLRIDADSGQPVYLQLARQLEDAIRRGRLAAAARLPAIRSLALELGVHRDTVAMAYERLAKAGWVDSRVGRGTFVALRAPEGGDRAAGSEVDGGSRPALSRRETRRETSPEPTGVDEAPRLAPAVDRLIALDNMRPRYATGDDVIALHKLIPDVRFYPTEAFRACLDAALDEDGPELFSYASPEGDPRLRRAMAGRMHAHGLTLSAEELVLCHGASQGISLALRLFAAPGDQVAVEAPTYANVLSACAGLGLSPVPVPTDEAGPDPEALDRTLARSEVKAFYTIPTFHNPLGMTMPLERRRTVLEIARRHRVPVIEDGFEMDLRFRGRAVPPLAALDDDGLVVLLFSYSKSLFPGIRVGSISGRGRALEGLVALKSATDLSDARPMQAALARFLESGGYDDHLARIRGVLRRRHDAMDAALTTAMPEGTRWTRPEGGYQCWVELPFEIDTRDLLADAARAGVLFSPGALFMPDARPSRGMRLTVACADEDEIRRGVAALGETIARAAAAGAGRAAGMHL